MARKTDPDEQPHEPTSAEAAEEPSRPVTDEVPRPQAPREAARPREPLPPPEDEPRGGRFARLTKRLLDRGEDGRTVLSAVLETSDWARAEMVRLVGKEVRMYLDALELKEDLLHLVRSHSLEVHASFRLKPLPDAPEPPAPAPAAKSAAKSAGDGEDGAR
jgi:hypothetical protein